MAFHEAPGQREEEKIAGNVREFHILNELKAHQQFLRTPGLLRLIGVRVGNTPIPLERVHEAADTVNRTKIHSTMIPTLMVCFDTDGCPGLMRATHSNDGLWQHGETIYVQGDWSEEEPAPVVSDRSLESLSIEELADALAAKKKAEAVRLKAEADARKATGG